MTGAWTFSERSISLRRGALTLIIAATLYEALARSGYFPEALTPTLPTIARTLFASLADGTMLLHAAATLYRVLIGFGSAVAIGLPLGVLMGRFRPVENFVLPLMSALMPIPSLAWVPVFHPLVRARQYRERLHRFLCRAVPDAAQYLVGRARGEPDLATRGERHGR